MLNLIRRRVGGWKAPSSGDLPLTAVTISAASSRSFTLRFCEARRSRSNAASASQRCWDIMIPIARSMTAREVNAWCRLSDSCT